jgi:hypothetical protein
MEGGDTACIMACDYGRRRHTWGSTSGRGGVPHNFTYNDRHTASHPKANMRAHATE